MFVPRSRLLFWVSAVILPFSVLGAVQTAVLPLAVLFIAALVLLEAASPLGFWAVRRSLPINLELRVYPNLLRERKSLAALFLNRGAFGLHAQRQIGKGRDFEKLREYIPGDSSDEIHWKATAKRGHPVTKVFQIERTQEVYVIIDASRLSARTAGVRSSDFGVSNSGRAGSGEAALSSKPETRNPEQTLERFI